MSEEALVNGTAESGKRDRSPSFPYIGLGRAVERTRQLSEISKRREVRLIDAAKAWGFQPKSSSVLQTVAALLAFGLIEDEGSNEGRKVRVSDLGRRIIEDQRPGAREGAMAEAALRPKLIAEIAREWEGGRPGNPVCLSELTLDRGFSDDAAKTFLRVFDETIQFAETSFGDKFPSANPARDEGDSDRLAALPRSGGAPDVKGSTVQLGSSRKALMDGEREIATGLLSKDASFRLIVSGKVGEKEIERLIKKLTVDKEILAENGGDADQPKPENIPPDQSPN